MTFERGLPVKKLKIVKGKPRKKITFQMIWKTKLTCRFIITIVIGNKLHCMLVIIFYE